MSPWKYFLRTSWIRPAFPSKASKSYVPNRLVELYHAQLAAYAGQRSTGKSYSLSTNVYNKELRSELQTYAKQHAPKITFSMFGCDLNVDCRAVIFKPEYTGEVKRLGARGVFQIAFPCRVRETNLFPSEKLLQYMELKSPIMKKAKPRDWISILDNALQQHFPEEYIP